MDGLATAEPTAKCPDSEILYLQGPAEEAGHELILRTVLCMLRRIVQSQMWWIYLLKNSQLSPQTWEEFMLLCFFGSIFLRASLETFRDLQYTTIMDALEIFNTL